MSRNWSVVSRTQPSTLPQKERLVIVGARAAGLKPSADRLTRKNLNEISWIDVFPNQGLFHTPPESPSFDRLEFRSAATVK